MRYPSVAFPMRMHLQQSRIVLLVGLLAMACGSDDKKADKSQESDLIAEDSGGFVQKAGDRSSDASATYKGPIVPERLDDASNGRSGPSVILPPLPDYKPDEASSDGGPKIDISPAPVSQKPVVKTPPADPIEYLRSVKDTSSYGALMSYHKEDFWPLTDAPGLINNVTLQFSRTMNFGVEGMCHGMAYVVGFLALRGFYAAEASRKGVDIEQFALSYLSGGSDPVSVLGYGDMRSYSAAEPEQFRAIVDKLQVLRNAGSFLGTLFQKSAKDRLTAALSTTAEELASFARAGGYSIVILSPPDAFNDVSHAVLLYATAIFAKAYAFFIYDPNVLYDAEKPHATVLIFERSPAKLDWGLYNNAMYGGTFTRVYWGSEVP